MREYLKHPINEVDLTILDRLSESDVVRWCVAKHHQLRQQGLPIGSMELNVWHRNYRDDPHYDTQWDCHCPGPVLECADTLEKMVSQLKHSIAGMPRDKASDKRLKARLLIQEAESLEETARALDAQT